MATTQHMTAEDLARIEEPGRYDLIRGEIVCMPPAGGRHGEIEIQLARHIANFVLDNGLGKAYGAETGFFLSRDPDIVLAPDAAFVSTERLPAEEDRTSFMPIVPDLAVEIISPSDRNARVTEKVIAYLEAGTHLVWVIEPGSQTVTVYTPDRTARILISTDTLDGGDVLPGFELQVAEIFQ